MSSRLHLLLKTVRKLDRQRFSTAVNVKKVQDEPVSTFRTLESDPSNHNESHLNRFYTIPKDIYSNIYQEDSLPKEFQKQVSTFKECSILVRKPAVELISYLNQADYKRPVNRYVLYGKFGTGKTITTIHVMHYAHMQKFIILHVPWALAWFRFPKEVSNSALDPEMIDLPVDAGFWLKYFKNQNLSVLTELDLKVSKDYEWSSREVTKSGAPLLELIDFGINRIKFACAVINALVDELKAAGIAGKCRTLVAIDGFNAFFSDYTGIRDEDKKVVPPHRVSLTKAFVDSANYDWCNGAVLLTVDTRATKDRRDSIFPRYLLGKEGFEYVDPFLPIAQEDYTPDEFESVMEYYKNRKWVREITPEGQKEIELLSNRNPFGLFHCCKPL